MHRIDRSSGGLKITITTQKRDEQRHTIVVSDERGKARAAIPQSIKIAVLLHHRGLLTAAPNIDKLQLCADARARGVR